MRSPLGLFGLDGKSRVGNLIDVGEQGGGSRNESIIYSLNNRKLVDFLHLQGTLLHAEEDTGMKNK